MKFEDFKKLLNKIEKQEKVIDDLYKRKIDLLNFVDPYNDIVRDLVTEIYGKDGYDWISWFVYDNEMGKRKFEAWDEDGNVICQDLKGLWEYLEKNKTDNGKG